MNARGQYGTSRGPSRTYVGASLVHVLELKQRYDNAKAAAVTKLLNELSEDGGYTKIIEKNRWEIALKNAGWVRVAWYPEFNGLEITITDRELHRSDEVPSVRREYEAILRRITPLLKTYGATTVGATVVGYAPQVAQVQNARGQYGGTTP